MCEVHTCDEKEKLHVPKCGDTATRLSGDVLQISIKSHIVVKIITKPQQEVANFPWLVWEA